MKKINIHVKRIISVLAILLIFSLIWKFLHFILEDDTKRLTRLSFHEYYEQENIDVLFMGASHCQNGINTSIADDELGKNTFNIGSSRQTLDITYFLLEQALKENDLDKVVIELSYNVAISNANNNEMTRYYIATDYMHPSLELYAFLLEKTSEDTFANTFLVARRNWEKIFDVEYIKNLVEKKLTISYKNYEYFEDGLKEYVGKGSVASHEILHVSELFDYVTKDEKIYVKNINSEWIENLKNIIRLCKEHDIELIFISTPIANIVLKEYGNYDVYIEYVKKLISEESEEIKYYDFNLLKTSYWSNNNNLFYDENHLNEEGSKVFTKLLCDLINEEVTETELFYTSIEERFEYRDKEIYGATHFLIYDDPENNAYCQIIGNGLDSLITRVTLINEEGKKVVKDWNQDTSFKMLKWYEGKCIIEYAEIDNPNDIKVIELDAKGFY